MSLYYVKVNRLNGRIPNGVKDETLCHTYETYEAAAAYAQELSDKMNDISSHGLQITLLEDGVCIEEF
jgi:hypothetical protein